ncbi:MAG: outer membrane beta-barrel protein [Bacteroidota bacterium]
MKQLLIFSALFVSVLGYCQKGDLYVGLELGPATIDLQSGGDDNKSNIHFGAMGEYFFGKHWSVKAKLKYYEVGLLRGAPCDGFGFIAPNCNEDDRPRYKANMLGLPVMAKWDIGNGRFKGYLQSGMYVALEVNSEYQNDDFRFEKSALDYGFISGLGLQYGLYGDRFIIYAEGEYLFGIKAKAISVNENFGSSINLRTDHFSIGLKMKLE